MDEIKILGQTPKEIAEQYFNSPYFFENYSKEEQNLLKEGFIEGIEYLYPLYESADSLVKLYTKLENMEKTN